MSTIKEMEFKWRSIEPKDLCISSLRYCNDFGLFSIIVN